jgi:hypothetical protein
MKKVCVGLVIYKDYTEMLHGQQNIKFWGNKTSVSVLTEKQFVWAQAWLHAISAQQWKLYAKELVADGSKTLGRETFLTPINPYSANVENMVSS